MQETLNSKKKGDAAFRHKEFKAAIDCYSQVRSPMSCLSSLLVADMMGSGRFSVIFDLLKEIES